MLRNTFTNRLLLVTAVLCTASLLFFANACNEKLGVVDAEKGFPAESVAEFGQGYLIGFHGKPDEELIRNVGGRILRAYNNFPILHVDVPEHAVQELRDNPNVRHLVRNTLLSVERSDASFMDLKGPGFGIASEPKPECDVDSYKRYNGKVLTDYIDRIRAPAAWDKGFKGQGIRVAILDSGIDDSHPDLSVNKDECCGFTKYQTGHPRNFRPWYFDTEGYGTLKAGVIGAHGDSHLLGVAPKVELISVKIMMNAYPMEWVIDGIDWCIDFNKLNEDDPIRIMYMGFGYYQNDMDEEENFERYNALLGGLINEAYNDGGMLIVASAGNIFDSGVTKVRYPAAFDNVIAVSAANAAVDGLSAISRFGTEIELIAPGENIYTTSIENARYECREGTAYSAGFVAGAAALVWSAEPGLTNKQVRDILTGNTEWIVGLDEGQQGNGLVRVDLALGIDDNGEPPPVVTYTITASAGTGGTIDPSGDIPVIEGADQTFTIIADDGYQISYVLVDGSSVGAVSSYTFNNVTADHTINASFAAVPTYTINSSAGDGGTINPFGEVVVNEGANQMFTIAASSGFQISDVLVDGSTVGAVSSYTFNNVTDDHTIHATFETAATAPLSIEVFDLTNTSNPQFARVTVHWEVSGENLSTVVVAITGPNSDSRTWNLSGSTASGQHEFAFRRGFGTYNVTLTVTDDSGTISDSDQITL